MSRLWELELSTWLRCREKQGEALEGEALELGPDILRQDIGCHTPLGHTLAEQVGQKYQLVKLCSTIFQAMIDFRCCASRLWLNLDSWVLWLRRCGGELTGHF